MRHLYPQGVAKHCSLSFAKYFFAVRKQRLHVSDVIFFQNEITVQAVNRGEILFITPHFCGGAVTIGINDPSTEERLH